MNKSLFQKLALRALQKLHIVAPDLISSSHLDYQIPLEKHLYEYRELLFEIEHQTRFFTKIAPHWSKNHALLHDDFLEYLLENKGTEPLKIQQYSSRPKPPFLQKSGTSLMPVSPDLISSSHDAKSLNSSLVIPTILSDASPVLDLHCEDWKRAKPTTRKYENCPLNTLAFQVIRIRSLIVEALFKYTVNLNGLDSEVLDSIIETGWKTSDVIEHIAKEAVDGQLSPRRLIQDLETAVYLLNKFELELKNSPSHLPSRDEINALKQDLLIRDKVKETPTSKQLSRALIPKAIESLLSLIANIAITIRMNSAYSRESLTNPNTPTNVMFLSDMLHNLHFLGRAIEEDDTCRLHIEIDKQIGCWENHKEDIERARLDSYGGESWSTASAIEVLITLKNEIDSYGE